MNQAVHSPRQRASPVARRSSAKPEPLTCRIWRPRTRCAALVGFTVDFQFTNPDFVRLVMTEIIHRGEYLAQVKSIKKLNVPACATWRRPRR